MIDLEDKRIKIAVILVAIVGFATYNFYPKDEYVMEMVKPTRPPAQKIEEIKDKLMAKRMRGIGALTIKELEQLKDNLK